MGSPTRARRERRPGAVARNAASAGALVAAVVADLAVPLPYPMAAFYAIPVLLAAGGRPAGAAVMGTAAVALFIAAGVLQQFGTAVLAVYGGALAAVAYLAVRLATQREQTAQRAMEAEAARGTLDRTRHTLEALVAESPLAIIVSNADGTVRLWNPAAERIFGWRADEVLGRFLPTVPEELREDTMTHLRAALAGRVLRRSETVRRRKDGSTLEVEVWCAPLVRPGADGVDDAHRGSGSGADEGPGVLTLMADVTEQAAARRDLERLAAELGAAVRARDEFLSVAAHELKTPATSLRSFAQLTLRRLEREGTPDPERVRRTMEVIDGQTARLARLTEQLLDVSRIQLGRLALETGETDVAALARGIAAAAQARTDRHDVTVSAPAGPVVVCADSLRLEQVLVNLLDNAIKYSPEGGPIEVTVSPPDAGRVRLSVRDHGIGIPPERRGQIFERYYQAHPEHHYGGMGLGLHISREIVALHGGTIDAEFPEDGGSRFVVVLPCGPADQE